MVLNRSDKSRILRRYFPGMTRQQRNVNRTQLAFYATLYIRAA